MKLDGNITFLVNQDGTNITIRDEDSNQIICEVVLTPEQLSKALSRLSHTPCKIEVFPSTFGRIGKEMEVSELRFEIPESIDKTSTKELREHAQTLLEDGWIADNYFGSQNSFYREGEKQYARVTVRRWV